ncbi:kinesin-related protein 4-like isoform X3 [Octopus vulgaris]|uniref:Kinesin-related protein 4-like isoform X3 n=1 Tax=Octopus vulgaris TaxID=6645 RepID=A0AA36BUL6_OCTVU|nr:kinesin-related protein 4-like isoform X3 [Octopus vulgaris]
MGSKRKKNLSRSQRNKKNYVCKSRSKKNVTSIPEQGNFSTGIQNALPSTSGTLQVTEELHDASNSQLRPYVDDSSDDDIEIMSPEHKRRLNDCSVKLVENMIPDEMLNILLAKKVLTNYEMDTVKSKGIRMAMNEMLISLVTCKPDKAFSVLVEALKRSGQKHLAKLLTSTEYRKRKPGEISVQVDIENIASSDSKGKECLSEMYNVMKSLLSSINWQDYSPESHKEFMKQFDDIYKRCKKIAKLRRFLFSKDRAFTDITNGSIHLWFHCYTVNGLLDLWKMYKSGKFLHLLQECLIKPDIKQKFHPKIRVRIIDEEFQQCYQELSGQSFEENKDVTEDRKAVQKSPISARVKERITPQIIQPTGIKILKQKFILISEKMSDQPKEIRGSQLTKQNLRKPKSDPLSDYKVLFEESCKYLPNKNISQLASVVDESADSDSEKMMSEEHKRVELQSEEGEIYNAGSKNILINQSREDNPLISKYDQLPSTSANVEPSKFFQLASLVDESTDSKDSDSVKMISEEHKKLLKDNRVELVQNMIANDVLDHLLQKDVLTMSEKDRIKAEGASMNKKLIDTIMCKQDKAFFVFVDALKKTCQPHLADLLSTAKKRKPGTRCCRYLPQKRAGPRRVGTLKVRRIFHFRKRISTYLQSRKRSRRSDVIH